MQEKRLVKSHITLQLQIKRCHSWDWTHIHAHKLCNKRFLL